MQSMVDVVVAKYMRPAQATEFMEYLLRLALYDLEEVWADECAGLERRVTIATETASEHWRELQALRGRFAQMVMESEQQRLRADALEAEIVRQRGLIKAQEDGFEIINIHELLDRINTEAP